LSLMPDVLSEKQVTKFNEEHHLFCCFFYSFFVVVSQITTISTENAAHLLFF
jgi:hypothetical protein